MPADPPAPAPGAGSAGAPASDSGRGKLVKLALVCLPAFTIVVLVGAWWTRQRRLAADRRLARDCRERLEQLGRAAEKYAAANGGRYPYGAGTPDELMLRYLHHPRFKFCPATNRAYRWTLRERTVNDPPHLLLAWEDPGAGAHGALAGRHNVLFVGGRVKEISREELLWFLAEEQKDPPTPPRRRKTPRPGLREPPEVLPPGARPRLPPGTKGPPPPKYED